jgi:peptide/nickel transport system substrate-binding protein
MRRTALRLLAVCSLALLLAPAHARTRPKYGATLRADTGTVVMSGDNVPEVLSSIVFEGLVTVDDSGRLQPGLATLWSSENGGSHWQFVLRPNVSFSDGSALKPADVVRCMTKIQGRAWRVRATSDGVVFDTDIPVPNLPALLSLPQLVIYSESSDGVIGTGPFRLDKRIGPQFSLKPNDDYWGGRPYLDGVELLTSRSQRDQLNDFLLERADVIDLSPDEWRRALQDRMRVATSKPAELIYLEVDSSKPALRDVRLRQALSLGIDRAAIHNVIFQRQGEVAASLLPNWMSGYAFQFNSDQNLDRARQLVRQIGPLPPFVISYDPNDPASRLIAERAALNAHDIGINIQAQPNGAAHADIRVRTTSLPSVNPAAALVGLCDQLGLQTPITGSSLQSLYDSERAALETYTVIPLAFVPRATALRDRVRDWNTPPNGAWQFYSVWLARRAGEPTP